MNDILDGRPFRILCGDAVTVLRTLPAESVHCVVTSPPYWGLRNYNVDGQIGLERTFPEYVERLVAVFREVRRVLRDDGTLWLNLGDCYATGAGAVGEHPGGGEQGARWKGKDTRPGDDKRRGVGRPLTNGRGEAQAVPGGDMHGGHRGSRGGSPKQRHTGSNVGPMTQPNRLPQPGLKPKDLVGIPWRVAFALQADGWYLRSDVIWHKRAPMPSSVRDRPTGAHEYLFLLSKSERYFYDAHAIAEPAVSTHSAGNGFAGRQGGSERVGPQDGGEGSAEPWSAVGGTRNKRTVWTLGPEPFAEAHFATMPPSLVEPCILAGTSEHGVCAGCGAPWLRVVERREAESTGAAIGGDPARNDGGTRERDTTGGGGNRLAVRTVGTNTWRQSCKCAVGGGNPLPAIVIDPFSGAGTTALVATRLRRRALGIELNPDYVAMSERRIRGDAPLFHGAA